MGQVFREVGARGGEVGAFDEEFAEKVRESVRSKIGGAEGKEDLLGLLDRPIQREETDRALRKCAVVRRLA